MHGKLFPLWGSHNTLFLMIYVLTTWMLPQRLGRAERTASPDESRKVEPSIVPSILNPDWTNCPVKRRCMVIPGTQYTGHSLEITVLVVLSLGSMISCSIRTVLTATIKRGALESAVSMRP